MFLLRIFSKPPSWFYDKSSSQENGSQNLNLINVSSRPLPTSRQKVAVVVVVVVVKSEPLLFRGHWSKFGKCLCKKYYLSMHSIHHFFVCIFQALFKIPFLPALFPRTCTSFLVNMAQNKHIVRNIIRPTRHHELANLQHSTTEMPSIWKGKERKERQGRWGKGTIRDYKKAVRNGKER